MKWLPWVVVLVAVWGSGCEYYSLADKDSWESSNGDEDRSEYDAESSELPWETGDRDTQEEVEDLAGDEEFTSENEDSTSEHSDYDIEGEEEYIEWECTYRSPSECQELGYIDSCADRDCIRQGGWGYACRENGTCERLSSIDYGDEEASTDDYYGMWGGILTTALRFTGMPLIPYQDQVIVHYLLMRVSREGNDLVMHSKICYMQQHNFDEDKVYDIGEDLGQLVFSAQYANNVAILEHRVANPEAFGVEAAFETDWFWEVRGAKVDDPVESELPDRDHYTTYCSPWEENKDADDCFITDQDGDGHPGMTETGIGALNGSAFYHEQRWGSMFRGTVVDNDRIKGHVEHEIQKVQLDGANPTMIYDLTTIMHPEHERSYLRMLRMPENATCANVTEETTHTGSWLEFTAFLDDVATR